MNWIKKLFSRPMTAEVTNIEGANIKECQILVHERQRTFEVKEI